MSGAGGAWTVTVLGDRLVHLVLHNAGVTMCGDWKERLKVTDAAPTCPRCIAQAELNATNANALLDWINRHK